MPKLDVFQLVDQSTFGVNGRFGLTYRQIRGPRVVLEWFARRLLVPRDGIPWALGVGIDLPAFINATPTPSQISQWKLAFDAEGSRTEYVSRVVSKLFVANDMIVYQPEITIQRVGTFPIALRIGEAASTLVQFPIL